MTPTVPLSRSAELLRWSVEAKGLCLRRYRLEVIVGPDEGKSLVLEQPVILGTHSAAGWVLSDPTVSGRHAEFEPRAEGVRVRDLDSRNGTLISGLRVTDVMVERETVVSLGASRLRIAFEEERLGRPDGADSLGTAVGRSPRMCELFGLLRRVAPTDSTVLLYGETGTGKEVLARAIHEHSPRKEAPFVAVDSGAIAPGLVESELFGHVKGAFTGATANRTGAFAQANGGTLFLDEIGELPLELQPKLLRALETRTVKRVGEGKVRSLDVRVVAATHRDLEAEVKAGRFREDLFFRLAVVPVWVPPLRDRKEDIALLAKHFLEKLGQGDFELSPALLERFLAYRWPGNVRELRNVVERALSAGEPAAFHAGREEGPGSKSLKDLPFKEAKEQLVEEFTRDYLRSLLERCEGNVSRAARQAGIARNHLQALMRKFGLRPRGS